MPINKIRKLLNMAKNGTIHEKETALLQAQRLMAKHHLSEHDIHDPQEEVVIVHDRGWRSIKLQPYTVLQVIIARNFRCRAMTTSRGGGRFASFAGYKTDAEVALDVFQHAYDFVKNEAERVAHYHYRQHGTTAGIRGDFVSGFVQGLRDAYDAQVNASEETAIMVVVPKEVDDYTDGITKGRNSSPQRMERGFNEEATRDGYIRGKKFVEGRLGKDEVELKSDKLENNR